METTLAIKVIDGIASFGPGQVTAMWKTLVAIGLSGFAFGMAFTVAILMLASRRAKKQAKEITVCMSIQKNPQEE